MVFTYKVLCVLLRDQQFYFQLPTESIHVIRVSIMITRLELYK